MLGLFGTLNLGARSLQTQQQGVEVAGHNLANASNAAYSRQRLQIQTSTPQPTSIGPQGTGADAVAITQLRDLLLDQQIQGETSVTSFLQSQQTALQYAQTGIGEQLQGAGTTGDVGSPGGPFLTNGGFSRELLIFLVSGLGAFGPWFLTFPHAHYLVLIVPFHYVAFSIVAFFLLEKFDRALEARLNRTPSRLGNR